MNKMVGLNYAAAPLPFADLSLYVIIINGTMLIPRKFYLITNALIIHHFADIFRWISQSVSESQVRLGENVYKMAF